MAKSDFFPPYFLNCRLHTGSMGWECRNGRGLSLSNPHVVFTPGIICSLGKNWKVPQHLWAETGRHKPRSACQPSPMTWVLPELIARSMARKRHFSLGHLTLCHSFQTLPLFFTLKSAPDTIFKTLPYLFLFKPNLRIQYYAPWGYRSHAHTSRYLLNSRHVFE